MTNLQELCNDPANTYCCKEIDGTHIAVKGTVCERAQNYKNNRAAEAKKRKTVEGMDLTGDGGGGGGTTSRHKVHRAETKKERANIKIPVQVVTPVIPGGGLLPKIIKDYSNTRG